MTSQPSVKTKVVVATTVMLSFISFWRASAIVLSDLASSAYYAGGIAETAIGKSAPWFILGIMLFGFAVRAIYVESCSMFVRGGVYRVVHEAMGATLAKFSVSALMFDYVLTGPISGVSAGLYLAGLINDTADYLHQPWHVPSQYFAAAFALVATLYFWRQNLIGIEESSGKALRIMQVTTAMVVILISWCLITVLVKGYQPVPLPVKQNLHFGKDALGWLEGTFLPNITAIAIMIGLGHSLLAMSGFETLAQVYRELAAPKLKNLQKTGTIVIIYSLLFTALVSFFAVMLIPDTERGKYLDNLIGGLSMYLVGPVPLKLLFHAFVVLVGTLILSGAVNTAIIGSNGVLNRVAEDGVMPDWFRQPSERYGTTSRIINLVVIMQIVTILISRGDVNMLGEAYAFGVVWSFAMKSLAVLVLRFKRPEAREWKVPLNFRVGHTEVPLGLALITLALFALALTNVLTKKTATISGSAFTAVFFIAFQLSERHNRKKHAEHGADLEKFRLDAREDFSAEAVRVRPGSYLVAIRNPEMMQPLDKALKQTDPDKVDLVVLNVRELPQAASGEFALKEDQIFNQREAALFTRVVNLAEKAGKHVNLMVVPSPEPCRAIVETAQKLGCSRVFTGISPRLQPEQESQVYNSAFKKMPEPRQPLDLEIVTKDGQGTQCRLGAPAPQLWPDDSRLVDELCRSLSERQPGTEVEARDILGVALRQVVHQINSAESEQLIQTVLSEAAKRHGRRTES